ncbi:hypothetical protein C1H76_7722 [Elsinoe australis]|uniref:DNA replication regulator SLD2 n=1 Tax=Elsinoe australis TaxID=40998 RepID=A0A4U7ATQ7_9PEZI|nr:hypothetical protein C1H76_7722 [Elsinoe australis]
MDDIGDHRLRDLKLELKFWERSFAAAHGGRKPAKTDIKADAAISAKYKQYDLLCRPDKKARSSPKRSRATARDTTKSKDHVGPPILQIATPSKSRTIPSVGESPEKSPLPTAMSPTPQALRQRLGPTPQKDGQILSLFDSICTGTPSRRRTAFADIDANIAATPSKKDCPASSIESEETENARLGRTPTSSGKRYMLDTFATPMKRKRDEVAQTPSSVRGVNSTPQFLRRTNILFSKRMDPVQETDEDVIAKTQPPFKKRSLVRSLSSIIKGLKAQEEDKADEDLELLREMEGDPFEPVPRAQMQRRPEAESHKQAERVPEMQVDMPLGPDMLPVSDGELSDKDLVGSLDANGQPRKVWKKKGLKRQTKQVKMRPAPRPTKTDDRPATDLMDFSSVKDDKSDQELPANGSDSDFSDSVTHINTKPGKTRAESSKPKSQDVAAEKEPQKKKKVSATAHANYCRLKIKNKNSNANGRGRFGRR